MTTQTAAQAAPEQELRPLASLPAKTWHRLSVNDEKIALPEDWGYASTFGIELDGSAFLAEAGLFEREVAAFQAVLDTRRAACDSRAVVRAARGETQAGDLDAPALSSYQREAVLDELAHDARLSFETGLGPACYDFIAQASDNPVVFSARAGQSGGALIRIDGKDGCANVVPIDVVAPKDAHISVEISLDSPEKGEGLVGVALRIFAAEGSRVEISSLHTLDDSWISVDDSGYIAADDAQIVVNHRVLGAGSSFTGLRCDLWGNRSQLETATRYVGVADEKLSFNYVIKQRGLETHSDLDANGVLAGSCAKTLRGTIDFVHGCKGSTGNERETVLLADDGVDNKTVPVILCDEDDVMGNHGATIGHVKPDQRFYLQCRGLSDEALEQLFTVAAIEEAHLAHRDSRMRAGIARLATDRGIDADVLETGEGE